MKATIIIAAVTGLALGGIAGAAPVYLTNFPKTANLANNLNQQYPNTGFTAGGSATGNPNVSVLYDPATYTSPNIVPAGNFVTNGITFTIASDALGHDYSELVGTSVTVPVNAVGVSSLHLLLGAYFGVNASVTLTGAAGGSQTFAPFFVPDFNGGGTRNTSPYGGLLVQSVLQVNSVGGGGSGNSTNGAFNNYFLYEYSLTVDPALTAQGITSFTLSSAGSTTLLVAATASVVPEPGIAALLPISCVALTRRSRRNA